MSNGPLPSTLTLLTSLRSHETGTKVRFLGCVTHYHLPTGTLSLQHAYAPSPPPATSTVALVDVNLLLEGMKREDTVVGAWVNVVGYVGGVLGEGKAKRNRRAKGAEGERGENGEGVVRVRVQAVMLWSAGGLKIGEYEKAVEGRMSNERRG